MFDDHAYCYANPSRYNRRSRQDGRKVTRAFRRTRSGTPHKGYQAGGTSQHLYCGQVIKKFSKQDTAPQHLVCRAVRSLHFNRMQTGIIEVFVCRCLQTNTSTILICIWLICRLCTTLHTKCCGAVRRLVEYRNQRRWWYKKQGNKAFD